MAEYFAFITKEGLDAIAWCVANPPNKVMFKQMAIGDLNDGAFPSFWAIGVSYTSGTVVVGNNKSLYTCILNHTSSTSSEPGIGVNWTTYWSLRTIIVNEQYRSAISAVYVHPNNPNWIVVEGVVPDDQGGWWIREVGLYADSGTGPVLFGVAKFPPSYKPVLASGSGKDFYIRIVLVVSDINVISLIMDPSVVLATQIYVNNYAYWATEADRLWNKVLFEPDVEQNDVVYYNVATSKFGRALADGTIKQNVVGFADLTPNYRNMYGQVIIHGEMPYTYTSLNPGVTYYLSPTSPGKITSIPPTRYTVKVGIAKSIGVMMVDIDNILSGYEDIAFTSINSSGDVVLNHHLSIGGDFASVGSASIGVDLTAGRDLSVARDITGGREVRIGTPTAFSVASDATVVLGRGHRWVVEPVTGDLYSIAGGGQGGIRIHGGWDALTSDLDVTGGTDNVWGLHHRGVTAIQVWDDYEVSLRMGGMMRRGSVVSSANNIPLGKANGKIDSSWIDFPTVAGWQPVLTYAVMGTIVWDEGSPGVWQGGYIGTLPIHSRATTLRVRFRGFSGTHPGGGCDGWAKICLIPFGYTRWPPYFEEGRLKSPPASICSNTVWVTTIGWNPNPTLEGTFTLDVTPYRDQIWEIGLFVYPSHITDPPFTFIFHGISISYYIE